MILQTLLLCVSLHLTWAQQTFALIGGIRDTGGRPVGDVRVSLTDENNQPITTKFADNSGRFTIRGLRSGRYQLRVEATGKPYEEYSQSFELQATSIRRGAGEEPFVIDIVLTPKRGASPVASPRVLFTQDVPAQALAEYERGSSSIQDGKSDQGMSSLKKAIEIFPDYFLALELLGTEQVRRGEYRDAVPVLTHAVEVNRSAPKSSYALGVAYLKLNHMEEAIEALKAATDQDPQNANAYMMLGLAYGSVRASEAEAAFKKAYEVGRERAADAHLYLAAIYNKQEKYQAAIRELELFLKEAKEVKDRAQIRDMIEKLKAKEKSGK